MDSAEAQAREFTPLTTPARALLFRGRMRNLLLHVLHLVLPGLVLMTRAAWPVKALACATFFLGAFALFHDVAHANLRLHRDVNELLLALSGAAMGISGVAGRRAHLFHHAHPGREDDMEGRDIDSPLGKALLRAPQTWFALVARRSNARRESMEWLLAAVVALALSSFETGRIYLAVVVLAQLTMPLWAARLSHRPPRLLARIAQPFAEAGVSLAVLFLTHHAHHERPWVPTFDLKRATAGARAPYLRDARDPGAASAALLHARAGA